MGIVLNAPIMNNGRPTALRSLRESLFAKSKPTPMPIIPRVTANNTSSGNVTEIFVFMLRPPYLAFKVESGMPVRASRALVFDNLILA